VFPARLAISRPGIVERALSFLVSARADGQVFDLRGEQSSPFGAGGERPHKVTAERFALLQD